MTKWHVTVSGTFTEVYEVEADTPWEAVEVYKTKATELDKVAAPHSEEWVEHVNPV